ncbi:MAG: ATP-dependent DNA helicase RecG, partial [Acutalibacteraceae bacterium]|nr:ATP-dependent DNA helicase RecG [Acutalibacteraceae bacterium]
FGLSQLHQLRGRIGRGKHKSTCILISDAKGETARDRLSVIKGNNDGFHIAEEDLRLRGPGDFLGSRQHGLPELRIADIYTDTEMLKLTGLAAAGVLESDPRLKAPENLPLREEIIALYKKLNEN